VAKVFDPILNLVRFHKMKILLLFGLYVLFMYMMFPFNDLGDLVSSKVSEVTQGQVFIDFDKLNLSLLPSPGIELGGVTLDTAMTGSVTAKSIEISPSIPALLTFKPGATIKAEDLLGGDIDISTRPGKRLSNVQPSRNEQKFDADLSEVNLSQVAKMLDLPLQVDGQLSGSVQSAFDPMFAEQPNGDIDLHATRAVIPEGNVNTPMGPLTLPRMNLGEITVQSHAENGRFEIQKFVVGKPGGDLYANVAGRVEMRVSPGPNMIPGAYDLNIHLQVGEAFKSRMAAFLSFLSAYQSGPNSYAFRVQAPNPYGPPNITKLQ
jgi:type II secretion system protein N